MPLYTYSCIECKYELEDFTPVDHRDHSRVHVARDHVAPIRRKYDAPYPAAIPGIYNRINKDWREPDPEPWEHDPKYQTVEQKRFRYERQKTWTDDAKA